MNLNTATVPQNGHDTNGNKVTTSANAGGPKVIYYQSASAAVAENKTSETENGNHVNKTRETVQKVYQLLERTRSTSTSSSIDEKDDQLNDNRRNSQQRGRGRGGGGQMNGRGSRSSQSPAATRARQSPPAPAAEEEPETEEESQLAKLRCPSLSTEAVSEREQRRRKRMCSDYPGLAFGLGSGSVFGSDTMMKFSLIKNELSNVINGQLKRTENEVATFNRRIQLIEDDLEKSKAELGAVTEELAETVNSIKGSAREELEMNAGQEESIEDGEDDLLDAETKSQVRLISEESNKVYNEVVRRLIIMEKELEALQEREEQNDMTIIAELRCHGALESHPVNLPLLEVEMETEKNKDLEKSQS